MCLDRVGMMNQRVLIIRWSVVAVPQSRVDGVEDQVGFLRCARLPAARSQRTRAEARLKDADKRLRRHQAAIEAGVNPAALVELINAADAERPAAKAELETCPSRAK
jgi:hypothetical protein